MFQAEKIKKPLFVLHGANDPRVPLEETRQIAKAVRANEVQVWTLVFPDEGHGEPSIGFGRFQRPENDLLAGSATVFFLEKYLLGGKE